MKRSKSITKLAPALRLAQSECANPKKDASNPHFKSRYADLASVRDAIMPVFLRHELAVVQIISSGGNGPTVTTVVIHSSGEYLETSSLTIPASRQDAQGWGSAITYARRYTLQATGGVTAADDDDDGESASGPDTRSAAAQAAPAQSRPTQTASRNNGPQPIKRATPEMCAELERLITTHKLNRERLAGRLEANHGTKIFAELSILHADEVLIALRKANEPQTADIAF